MTYHYRARDSLGNVLEGDIDAANLDEAGQHLRRDGLAVIDLAEAGQGLNFTIAPWVRRQDIIYTTSQLSLMVDTGITLSSALGSIAQVEQNATWKRVLEQLRESVESGEDFSAALARHPRYFDETYVSLIRASESTGTLGEMLDRIATYMRKELETIHKVRAALAYPAVMLVMSINIVIFLLTWVFPKFAPLFERRGTALPKPTRCMLAISHFLTDYWYIAILGAAGLVFCFVWGKRTPLGRDLWDWCKINVPVLGKMQRKVVIGRSIRTLGAMLAGGVPMLQALDLCSRVSANVYYRRLWLEVAEAVTEGKQVHDALAGNPLLPATLVQMIAAGEETGKIDEVLARVSDYYEHEVEQAVKAMTSIIEPAMIGVMGVVVGGIAMSLLLPIFSLSHMTH
ncbi:MAG: type II secretion system F family protein [Pirellulales bacterium]|nr:type II secretion system F family protein [Pirellulales bacterium]